MTPDTVRAIADARLQRELDRLEDEGVELLTSERVLLVAAPEEQRDAWLASLHRAVAGRVPRQVVRYAAPRRPDAEKRFHEQSWRISDDGTGFSHTSCGLTFRGYDGPMQSAAAAAEHHRRCDGVRRV